MVRFFKDQSGSATVEFALWIPLFFAILGIMADATLAFSRHSDMISTASNIARMVALGNMSQSEAIAFAAEEGYDGDPAQVFVTKYADYTEVTITTKVSDIVISKFLGSFTEGESLTARAIFRNET